jgi:hypothetical protein
MIGRLSLSVAIMVRHSHRAQLPTLNSQQASAHCIIRRIMLTGVSCCCLQSATEAACLILSVDETVKNPRSEAPDASMMGPGRGGGRGMRGGRGRGMRR